MNGGPLDEWRDDEFCEPYHDDPQKRNLLEAAPGESRPERVTCHHDGTYSYFSVTEIRRRNRVRFVWYEDRPFIREQDKSRARFAWKPEGGDDGE